MRFIGIDLAWGRRNPSGLCVVEDGRAVDSALHHTDEKLLDWLRRWTRDPCVVAIDAPLVITNTSGARSCERTISRCFARFEAGCHPTNLSRTPQRALRLATALGLDPNPAFEPGDGSVRRAVEVYPHAALVALFGLARTLKYKARKGRSVTSRHQAFCELTHLLTTLLDGAPPLDVRTAPRWQELVDTATRSPVGAALDRVEDEIDAFVCAYVALQLWTHGTAHARIVGSATDGYIVTPVTPILAECLDRLAVT